MRTTSGTESEADAERSSRVGAVTDTDTFGADGTGQTSRRGFLATTAATGAFALAGCTGGGGGPLTVSTWSGANFDVFRETIAPMYEAETGNEVEVVDNWANILGQIRQSPSDDPPFDLTVGSARDHYLGDQDGLWEPIRYENVPNADAVKPTLVENIQSDDGVPVAYGIMGYAYDADAIGFEPESWSDLVTEDAAEKFALPGSYFLNSVIMAAIVADEASMAAELFVEDARDIDAIFETLGEMPISKFYTGATDMWTAISQGIANAGQYFYAYSVAKAEETSERDIGVHVPERTVGYVDHYQVARGTSNRTQAEEFIDFLLREDVQTAYAEAFNLGMANENATHPERTRAQLPIDNDSLEGNVVFKKYDRIADAASDLDERFKQFQGEYQS